MPLTSPTQEEPRPAGRGVDEFGDRPLNYYSDQLPDLEPRIRRLNLEWGAKTALEQIVRHSSELLLACALTSLYRRKLSAASFFAAGFFLQRALKRRRPEGEPPRLRRSPQARGGNDAELERYAMKAQRGDYGKLEVIPFK